MTVSTDIPTVRTPGARLTVVRPAVVRRGALAVAVVAAVALAVAAAHDGASARAAGAAGPELTRVLGVMAPVKAALAAGALWGADRRLHHPATPVVAAAWIAACALMAAATGLIWSLAHVAAGAAAFHAGLALLVVLGRTDRANRSGAAPRVRAAAIGGGSSPSRSAPRSRAVRRRRGNTPPHGCRPWSPSRAGSASACRAPPAGDVTARGPRRPRGHPAPRPRGVTPFSRAPDRRLTPL